MFFFFNDTATTEIYTLSLHDALPIYVGGSSTSASCSSLMYAYPTGALALAIRENNDATNGAPIMFRLVPSEASDRKSTRLNSSHLVISYAVFCLKKKKRTSET